MLKENRRTLIITSIVIILPVFAGLLLWDRLPDPMATHFGLDNQANGYMGKALAVFGIPTFMLVLHWFAAFVTAHDPRRQNITRKMYTFVLWLVPLISMYAVVMIYTANLGIKTDITFISEILMGIMFIVIGNYLPKARRNYTIGIKIPWTLDNEENWNRTHRLGGYLWVVCGFLMLMAAFTGIFPDYVMLVLLAVMVLVPVVYSYLLHEKHGL